MNYLLAYNTMVCSILFLMWRKNSWVNLAFKMALLIGAVGNGIALASVLGYVVHA